jgi:hypothetical protein
MKVSRVVLAGLIVALAGPVYAQSLAEIAKKEQERRKAVPTATKVYTNDDLKKITLPTDSKEPPAPTTGDAAKAEGAPKDGAAKGDGAKADEKAAAQSENDWRARMATAREDVRRGEMFQQALQSRINGLSADFTSRDDPAQRAQIGDDRQKAIAEMAQVTKDIEAAKKKIGDIEEEARRANVPPGWIR